MARIGSVRSELLGFGVLLAVVGVVYGPALWTDLAHPDDISVLAFWRAGYTDWWNNGWNKCGRFLAGLVHTLVLGDIDGLEQFRRFRWIGLAGFILWAGLLWRWLRGLIPQPAGRAAVLSLLALTPACAVFFTNAHFAIVFYGALLATLAGACLARSGPGRWGIPILAAALLFLAAMHIHQSAAGFLFLPLLVRLGEGKSTPGRAWAQVFAGIGILAAYWLFFQGFMEVFFADAVFAQRGNLPVDPLGRPLYFLGDFLYPALAGWALFVEAGDAGGFAAVLGAALATAGAWALAAGFTSRRDRVMVLSLLIVTGVLTVAPSLAARDQFFAFRLMAPLYAWVLLLMVFGIRFMWTRERLRFPLVSAGLVWLAAAFAPGPVTIREGLIHAQAREFEAIRDLVGKSPEVLRAGTIFVYPRIHDKTPALPRARGEVGYYNSAQTWVLPWYFHLFDPRANPLESGTRALSAGDPGALAAERAVYMDYLLHPANRGKWPPLHRLERREIPGLGGVYQIPGEGLYSPWLGLLHEAGGGEYNHPLLGGIRLNQAAHGGIWIYSHDHGWLWASPASWPQVHLSDPEAVLDARLLGD